MTDDPIRTSKEGAIVAGGVTPAALCAAVVAPASCGIGGYGAHATVALADGTVVAIDANSTAPAAIRPDSFPADAQGQVAGKANYYGWQAVGVPGTLAGLQLLLDRYGTWSLADVATPASELARNGFDVSAKLAMHAASAAAELLRDPESRRLYTRDGMPVAAGERIDNVQLAELLETLAKAGSVDSFYRGAVAQQRGEALRRHDALTTVDDLGRYEARKVEPLQADWGDLSIHTAPLTAGGVTTLQALPRRPRVVAPGVGRSLPADGRPRPRRGSGRPAAVS